MNKGSANPEQPIPAPIQTNSAPEEFHEMSDADLEKALTSPEPAADPAPEPPAPVAQDNSDKETPAVAPVAPAPEKDKAETPAEIPEADLKQAYESLKKQHENLQAVFGRQSNEIGRLRAQLKPKPTQEEFDADPVKATEQLQEHKEQAAEIRRLEEQQTTTEVVSRNVLFAQQFSPDLEANADTIRSLLIEQDKVPANEANQLLGNIFMQNPWGVFQLNQRAKAHKRIAALEKQVEELKKAPQKVVRQMKDVGQAIPGVSASVGQSSVVEADSGLSDSNELATMGTDSLEAMIKASLKKGK